MAWIVGPGELTILMTKFHFHLCYTKIQRNSLKYRKGQFKIKFIVNMSGSGFQTFLAALAPKFSNFIRTILGQFKMAPPWISRTGKHENYMKW